MKQVALQYSGNFRAVDYANDHNHIIWTRSSCWTEGVKQQLNSFMQMREFGESDIQVYM